MTSKIEELKQQLAQKEKEAEYYKHLAKKAGDERLRETEELSKLTSTLKEKIQIIEKQHKELEKLNQKIEKISVTDELTKLLNRRGIMMQVQKEFQNYKRRNYEYKDEKISVNKFVCAMLDLDFFKKINDTYGHLVGDKILIELSTVFSQSGILRAIDTVGRYGGEEFIIILPDCVARNSLVPLERLKQAIKNRVITIDSNTTISITVSIGVSEFQKEDHDVDEVISRADDALYYAKEHGRDRIILFSDIKGKPDFTRQ